MNFNPGIKQELNPASSIEAMFADKLRASIESGEIDGSLLNNDEMIKEAFIKKFKRHPKIGEVKLEDAILKLKNTGVIKPVVVEKIKKEEKEPEHIEINIPKANLKKVEDIELSEIAKNNIDFEEIEKQKKIIFENKEIINSLLEKSKERLKKDCNAEDYVKAGLYSEEEVDMHNKLVAEMENLFNQKNTIDEKEVKKLASIFEAIFIDGVNLSKCLGDDVIARPAFPYDDTFGSKIDAYLLLKNMPLGVDVSMRNIKGELFTKKVEKNLKIIKKEPKEKNKYLKDANGELKKDVFVPKVILSCDVSMIKELMYDFENLSTEDFSKKLKTHRMSREIVSQVVGQCRIFGMYAREIQENETANYYENILSYIDEISKESPILKRLMVGAGSDTVSRRIEELVNKFKEKEIEKSNDLEEFRNSRKVA